MDQGGLITRVGNWAAQPFKEDMDVWNWVLFLAFAITVVFLWTRILRQIVE